MHTRRADLLLAITADQVPDRSCAPRPLERKTSLAKLTFAGIAPGGVLQYRLRRVCLRRRLQG